MKKISTLLLLLLSVVFARAEFGILDLVPASGACNGSITVQADGSAGPFEIRLIDRSTNATVQVAQDVIDYFVFSDLCASEYDVLAINRLGCDHYIGQVQINTDQDCGYALEGDGAIEASIIDYDEPTFGNCNGYVSFSVSWLAGEIARISLFDATGSLLDQLDYEEPIGKFENLCGNTSYSIQVELADGCLLNMIEFDLDEICAANNVDLVRITRTMMSTNGQSGYNPNMDNCSGVIELEQLSGYSYEWDNGKTGSAIYNLCRGGYAVTITDLSTNCEDVRNYTVSFEDCKEPNFTSWEVQPYMGFSQLGHIQFTLPAYPLAFHTAELIHLDRFGLNPVISTMEIFPGQRVKFDNLTQGTYTLKIMSNCGYHEMEVVVPCMVDWTSIIALQQEQISSVNCSSTERISLNFLDPQIPSSFFRYEWSTGETGTSIEVSEFKEYRVKIFNTSNPSLFGDCYDEYVVYPKFINGIELVSTIGECLLLENGSALFSISNFEQASNVQVTLNGDDASVAYIPGDNTIAFDNLKRGRYSLEIIVSGCVYSRSFTIGVSDRFEAVPSGLTVLGEGLLPSEIVDPSYWGCTYDYLCDGEIYASNVPRERVFIDYTSGGNNCKVNLQCGNRIVGTHKFPKKSASVAEFRLVLSAALMAYSDVDLVYLEGQREKVANEKGCCRLRYCTANFRITAGPTCRLFATGNSGLAESDGDCIKIPCEDPSTPRIRICPERDYPPHILNADIDINSTLEGLMGSNCQKVFTYNVVQMNYWKSKWEAWYPSTFGSSILRDQINERMTDDPERSGCTRMTFCFPSFQLLNIRSTNLDCGIEDNCSTSSMFDPVLGIYRERFSCYNVSSEANNFSFPQFIYPDLDAPRLENQLDLTTTPNKDITTKSMKKHSFENSKKTLFTDFDLYPNPHFDKVNIKLNSPSKEDLWVNIYSILGQLVVSDLKFSKGDTTLEIDELREEPSGVYIVRILRGSELVATKKILKTGNK